MQLKRKYLMWSFVLVVTMIAAGEILARFYLGLGTPPLSVAHPKIEYMFKPSQDVYRFGNHIMINQYGMRTIPFNSKKADKDFRIMIFGDSVLNGGSLTDHEALATTILQNRLGDSKGNVIVGNISAGSWGPGNWLAYAKEFGFFEADIVILIISSHDFIDNPTFQDLDENVHPTKTPLSALLEGITRYLPRYLAKRDADKPDKQTDTIEEKASEKEAIRGLEDLQSFLELAKHNSAHVMVLQYWEKSEIEEGFTHSGYHRIKDVSEKNGISPISLEPYFRHSKENNQDPYRDNIHPNDIGQQLIANAILQNIFDKVQIKRR